MKLFLASLIHYLHQVIVLFTLGGWLLPTTGLLKGYIFFLALMLVQWFVCGNKCVLTLWEHRLRGAAEPRQEASFLAQTFERFTGRRATTSCINLVSYTTVVVGALLAYTRIQWMRSGH
jgi:hypothetical protein